MHFLLNTPIHVQMSQPFEVMKSVRKAMKDDGMWVIGDMNCRVTPAENIFQNPLAPMVYGFSCHSCLPSAMAGPNPAALGAMGLNEVLLKEKLLEAGFKDLEKLDFGHRMNQYWLTHA